MRGKQGRRWAIGIVICVALLVGAAFTPDVLLARELASARQEGLLTTSREIANSVRCADSENAAASIRDTIAKQRIDTVERMRQYEAARQTQSRTRFDPFGDDQAYIVSHPGWEVPWLKISKFPHLDFGRGWGDPLVLRPEPSYVSRAVSRFLGMALMKKEPERNILAAARLCALVAQEPGIPPLMIHISAGLRVLDVANHLGLIDKASRALGPVPTMRNALRAELVQSLAIQRDIRKREGWDILRYGSHLPLRQRLSGLRPFGLAGERETVHLYRDLFRDLRKASDLDAEFTVFMAHALPFSNHFQIYTKGLGPYFSLLSMSGIFHGQIKTYLRARTAAEKL